MRIYYIISSVLRYLRFKQEYYNVCPHWSHAASRSTSKLLSVYLFDSFQCANLSDTDLYLCTVGVCHCMASVHVLSSVSVCFILNFYSLYYGSDEIAQSCAVLDMHILLPDVSISHQDKGKLVIAPDRHGVHSVLAMIGTTSTLYFSFSTDPEN